MAIVCHLFLLFFLAPYINTCLSQQSSGKSLLQFKKSLTKSDSLYNWKDDGSNPCDPNNVWVGIICYNDTIDIINLSSMDLEGQPDVGALEAINSLKSLSFQDNTLSGPMPEINRLPHIKAFYAGSNWFTGVIPSDFFQTLGSLKRLWLPYNNFSGQIPTSIGELPNLKELHLEYNQFSGPIPTFLEPDVLTALDLSNNKLQGEIPKSLNNFDAKVFENNDDLCGPKLSKECETLSPQPGDQSKSSIKWIIMIGVVAILILFILARAYEVKQDYTKSSFGKGGGIYDDRDVVVNIPNLTKKTTTTPSSNRTTESNNNFNNINNDNINNSSSSGNINKNQNVVDSSSNIMMIKAEQAPQTTTTIGKQVGGVGDLVMVNEERGIFGLQDLMKAAAEVLGNGGLGSAYKATLGNGVSVVVKRVREMNEMTREVFDMEMKKLAKLKHQNILTPLAYHFKKEDKLLVSEYVSKGSLLYVLHGERGNSNASAGTGAGLGLDWSKRLKIIKGVARGMGFLHREFKSYLLPHGNLKSSNVLIGSDYEPLLGDYAFYPLLNNTPTAQCMFAFKSPEAILNQKAISHKSDVYCMGVVILEIMTGKYPSQYFNNQKDKGGTDVVQWVRSALAENRGKELIDSEISSSSESSVLVMEKVLRIGAACTKSEVNERIDLTEAIRRIDELSV